MTDTSRRSVYAETPLFIGVPAPSAPLFTENTEKTAENPQDRKNTTAVTEGQEPGSVKNTACIQKSICKVCAYQKVYVPLQCDNQTRMLNP